MASSAQDAINVTLVVFSAFPQKKKKALYKKINKQK